jgi:cell division protein FtsA
MLKNMRQFVEFYTGMNARIGNPNEHLAKVTLDEVKSPIYSTAVGLVMTGFKKSAQSANQKKGNIETSAAPQKKGWFPSLFEKAKDYLSDDMTDFEK